MGDILLQPSFQLNATEQHFPFLQVKALEHLPNLFGTVRRYSEIIHVIEQLVKAKPLSRATITRSIGTYKSYALRRFFVLLNSCHFFSFLFLLQVSVQWYFSLKFFWPYINIGKRMR